MSDPDQSEIRIDTGHSELGDFVRVTHLPSGTTVERNPSRGPQDAVRRELLQELTDLLGSSRRGYAYVLQHQRADTDDVKFIGVFSSETAARASIDALLARPGFREHPDGFTIDAYPINQVNWSDGFVPVP